MYKNLIYRYFTILMAMLVLTSGIGIGLVENECMMRGKTVNLAFKEKKKGCKLCRSSSRKEAIASSLPTDTPVFKKLHCCVEKQQHKSVEFQAVGTGKQLEKHGKPALEPYPASGLGLFLLEFSPNSIETSEDAPPISFSSPYFGRSMLSFVQQFLI